MIKQFFLGINCVYNGTKLFYKDKTLWKYSLLPVVATLLFYIIIAIIAFFLRQMLAAKLDFYIKTTFPDWLQWTATMANLAFNITFIISVSAFMSFTLSTFYETFACFFADGLVKEFEYRYFRYPSPVKGWKYNMYFIAESMIFGINTVLIMCLAYMISCLLPIFGHIAMILIIGHRLGMTFSIITGYNHKLSITETKKVLVKKHVSLIGFGSAIYLLTLVPFGIIVTLPGIVIGGTILFNSTQGEKSWG